MRCSFAALPPRESTLSQGQQGRSSAGTAQSRLTNTALVTGAVSAITGNITIGVGVGLVCVAALGLRSRVEPSRRDVVARARGAAGARWGAAEAMTDPTERVAQFVAELAAGSDDTVGVDAVDASTVGALLRIAREVAHGTERFNAPLCTYVAGRYVAARVAAGADEATAIAEVEETVTRMLAAPPPG